jgi:hypothetical protein
MHIEMAGRSIVRITSKCRCIYALSLRPAYRVGQHRSRCQHGGVIHSLRNCDIDTAHHFRSSNSLLQVFARRGDRSLGCLRKSRHFSSRDVRVNSTQRKGTRQIESGQITSTASTHSFNSLPCSLHIQTWRISSSLKSAIQLTCKFAPTQAR